MIGNVGSVTIAINGNFTNFQSSLSGVQSQVNSLAGSLNTNLNLKGLSGDLLNVSTSVQLLKGNTSALVPALLGVATGFSIFKNLGSHVDSAALNLEKFKAGMDMKNVLYKMQDLKFEIKNLVPKDLSAKGFENYNFQLTRMQDQLKDTEKLFSRMGQVNKEAFKMDETPVTKFFSGFRSGLNSIMSSILQVGALIDTAIIGALTAATIAVMKMGVEFNRQIEQLKVQLNTLGDTSDELYGKLQAYANVTPFTSLQVGDVAKEFMAFGAGVDQVMPAMKMLGDLSMGDSEHLQRLTQDFGKVLETGHLQGMQLRSMITMGFNPLQELARNKVMGGNKQPTTQAQRTAIGTEASKLRADMSAGKISADDVVKAMHLATSEGGRFNGMLKNISTTFNGLLSTLKDKWQIFTGKLSAPIFNGLKVGLNVALNLLDGLTKNVGILAVDFQTYVLPPLKIAVEKLALMLGLNGDFTNGIGDWFQGLGQIITTLTTCGEILFRVVNFSNIFILGLLSAIQLADSALKGLWYGAQAAFWNFISAVQNGWEDTCNSFARTFQPIVDAFNGVAGTHFLLPMTFTGQGGAGAEARKHAKDAEGELGKVGNELKTNMDAITAGISMSFNNVFKDLDTTKIDATFSKMTKWVAPAMDLGDTDWSKLLGFGGEDGDKTKDTTDGINKMADAIQKATDKLAGLGNMFDKLTYEKFSPEKLINRAKKYFDQLAQWSESLVSLQERGVSNDMLGKLREMGPQGFGIVKGMNKANDDQLNKIMDYYKGTNQLAMENAVIQVVVDMQGSVALEAKNNYGQIQQIGTISPEQFKATASLYSKNSKIANSGK